MLLATHQNIELICTQKKTGLPYKKIDQNRVASYVYTFVVIYLLLHIFINVATHTYNLMNEVIEEAMKAPAYKHLHNKNLYCHTIIEFCMQ